MTVTLLKPATPDPLTLAAIALAEVDALRGHDVSPSTLAHVLGDVTRALTQMVTAFGAAETVTEYGVQSWSRAYQRHHVDECADLHEALSVLAFTRKKFDISAVLVERTVPAVSAAAGEWSRVDPKEALAALEAQS